MDFAVFIHLLASVPALALGGIILRQPKGTKLHKAAGKTWSGLIIFACLSSVGIRDEEGNFTYIHLLTLWTFFCLLVALRAIKKKKVRLHKRFMIGTFIGLIVAGFLAVATPGRFLHALLFN